MAMRAGSAMLLFIFSMITAACSSGGADSTDYNRLPERIAVLEQQLTEQSQKLEDQAKQLEALGSHATLAITVRQTKGMINFGWISDRVGRTAS